MKIVIGIYCSDEKSPYYGEVHGKAYSDTSSYLLKTNSVYGDKGDYRGPNHGYLDCPDGHEFRYKEQEKTCWWWGSVPDELGKELVEEWLENRFGYSVVDHQSIDKNYKKGFVLAHIKV